MKTTRYISVILPLKLEWEPFYALPDGVDACAGDRVRVVFAGRLYLGVVSGVDVTPDDAALSRVREIREIVKEKQTILPTEITFWRKMAEYYMCSVGEVFKAAYPTVKDADVTPRKQIERQEVECSSFSLAENLAPAADAVSDAIAEGRTVLLKNPASEQILLDLCLRQKGNVIWLIPELRLEKSMEDRLRAVLGDTLVVWGSNLTPAAKRRVTRRIREGAKYVLLGTRSALFLPHRDVSLMIVSDEQDSSYKQTSPAPRYNGRDAAVMLASIFGAGCVLESMTPSLESMQNSIAGKYVLVETPAKMCPEYEIIDTRAETRKNGMAGELSRKLIAAVSAALESSAVSGVPDCSDGPDAPAVIFYKPRRAGFPSLEELQGQLEQQFGPGAPGAEFQGSAGAKNGLRKWLLTDDLVGTTIPAGVRLLVIFGADALLGKQDFRADERALQTVLQAVNSCRPVSPLCQDRYSSSQDHDVLRPLRVVIQTRESSHPVFRALASGDIAPLLRERRDFGLPPFTRLMDICFNDSFPDRVFRMQNKMLSSLGPLLAEVTSGSLSGNAVVPFPDGIRITLRRDRRLTASKQAVRRFVDEFEKREKYAGHIFFDVDPV